MRQVTRCRFEATDTSSDEVVVALILDVAVELVKSGTGALLSDETVWSLFKTCFRIARERRHSPLLRASAIRAAQLIVEAVFAQLPRILEEDARSSSGAAALSVAAESIVRTTARASGDSTPVGAVRSSAPRAGDAGDDARDGASPAAEAEHTERTERNGSAADGRDAGASVHGHRPYGLPAVIAIFASLCSLLREGQDDRSAASSPTAEAAAAAASISDADGNVAGEGGSKTLIALQLIEVAIGGAATSLVSSLPLDSVSWPAAHRHTITARAGALRAPLGDAPR